MELNVRRPLLGVGPRKYSTLVDPDGHRAAPRKNVFEAHPGHAPGALEVVVGGDGSGTFKNHACLQVVLQVLADSGEVALEVNAHRGKQRRRSAARKLQE